jgi:uncharacterized membrane protein YcaP (DUF421 family)
MARRFFEAFRAGTLGANSDAMTLPVPEPIQQLLLALAYYFMLVVLMRLAGKRLAGQTTTFDLIVLIALGVVLQQTMLLPGKVNAAIFIGTVFFTHRGLALWSARSRRVRRLLRGAPRPLIRDGQVAYDALEDEGLSYEELLAGLRKLGHAEPARIRLATLEETGHISAVPY